MSRLPNIHTPRTASTGSQSLIQPPSNKQLNELNAKPKEEELTLSTCIMDGIQLPDNFGIVNGCGRVFRSAFPKPENFEALKRLGLKTILTLVSDPYPEENQKFLQDNGITHVQIGMPGNKETQVTPVSDELISEALDVILDTQNHPILIHCNKGKHRTGTVVGCLRKIFGWSVPDSVEEYRHYAGVKVRPHDIMKIRSFSGKPFYEFSLPLQYTHKNWYSDPLPLAEEVLNEDEEQINRHIWTHANSWTPTSPGPATVKAK